MSYPLKRRAMALHGLTPIEVARVVKKLALRSSPDPASTRAIHFGPDMLLVPRLPGHRRGRL